MELTHYEAAERYLNAVMNGKTSIPLKSWKAERDKLNGGKKELTRQYYALKDEVKEVEQIRRNVYRILREENGIEQPMPTFFPGIIMMARYGDEYYFTHMDEIMTIASRSSPAIQSSRGC